MITIAAVLLFFLAAWVANWAASQWGPLARTA
jgi:hypothetical protein